MKTKENQKYLTVACADVANRIIFVSSLTNDLAKKGNKAAKGLIDEYKTNYPFYRVVVSDEIFLRLITNTL